ncbi:MAG: hypothetical protein E6H65_05020 [Betaproteobacteria bacterium]|nr:MAG: hypothetical protein E6H65_05020 [Betaproteobacteria bacterium]
MNEFAVPLQVLDDALGFPLTPQYVHKAKPDLALCERLYFALRDYHRRNTIQPLDRRFHRPNLSFVGAGSSVLVNTAFDGYAVNSFIPRNGETTLPIDDIKRALVYADAVIVEDPVFAFCRMVMCHRLQEAKPSFRALTQALEQLAQMRPLLEHQLLRLTAYFPEPSRFPRSGATCRAARSRRAKSSPAPTTKTRACWPCSTPKNCSRLPPPTIGAAERAPSAN